MHCTQLLTPCLLLLRLLLLRLRLLLLLLLPLCVSLTREADGVGFPLLVKAVAGGGGKGMKIAFKQVRKSSGGRTRGRGGAPMASLVLTLYGVCVWGGGAWHPKCSH